MFSGKQVTLFRLYLKIAKGLNQYTEQYKLNAK